MITIKNCPDSIPCMPEFPTLDGQRLQPEIDYLSKTLAEICPTLVNIGLIGALKETESVLAWNQTEKHTNAKWKTKSVEWHDSKAISHLNQSQSGVTIDNETQCRHRAHSICRLLMSLQHELNDDEH